MYDWVSCFGMCWIWDPVCKAHHLSPACRPVPLPAFVSTSDLLSLLVFRGRGGFHSPWQAWSCYLCYLLLGPPVTIIFLSPLRLFGGIKKKCCMFPISTFIGWSVVLITSFFFLLILLPKWFLKLFSSSLLFSLFSPYRNLFYWIGVDLQYYISFRYII